MPVKLFLAEMTREQIREIAAQTVVILPTSSTEQHGPHLPVCTDATICEAVCRAAAERASADVSVTIAPALVYGISDHHLPYPGVLSLPSLTFVEVVSRVAASLVASGFRKIVVVNGHGGNEEAVRIVARDLANTHAVAVAATDYYAHARTAPAVAEALAVGRVPGHAGHFETSLMLALRPELVDGRPAVGAGHYIAPTRPGVMMARSGGRIGDGPGHTDDASQASAELGRRLLDAIADELAAFLLEFAAA